VEELLAADWQPDPEEQRQAVRSADRAGIFRATPPFPACRFCAGARMPPSAFFIRRRLAHGICATASGCVCSTIGGRSGSSSKPATKFSPETCLVPGQRPESETVSETINVLCSDCYTDIGEGATYQSTWLNVTASPRD